MHNYSHNHAQNPYADNDFEVLTHMTPSEVEELTRLQGSYDKDPATGYPTFHRLWERMNHPEVSEKIIEWGRNGYASGGQVDGLGRAIERAGINGDSRMVKLPKPLAELFEHALYGGKSSRNPHTGYRQMFFGSLLGGLGRIVSPFINAVKPIAGQAISAIAPALGGLAKTGINALGQRFNMPNVANAVGDVASNAVNSLASDVGGALSAGQTAANPQFARNAAATAVNTATPYAQNYVQNRINNFADQYQGTPAHAPLQNLAPAMGALTNQGMSHFSNYVQNPNQPTGDYLTYQG